MRYIFTYFADSANSTRTITTKIFLSENQQGKSVLLKMTTAIDEDIIYKAINKIRSNHKRRPDISNNLLVKHDLSKSFTVKSIDGMVEEGKIYSQKTTTGEDSNSNRIFA